MKTAAVKYTGDLRTQATHIRSGQEIITDAPVDNNGKGEAFSPTDLVATALLSCMFTVIGIDARKKNMKIGDLSGNVKKYMTDSPRRISRLDIEILFTGHELNDAEKHALEERAIHCPVAESIHPDIELDVKFNFA